MATPLQRKLTAPGRQVGRGLQEVNPKKPSFSFQAIMMMLISWLRYDNHQVSGYRTVKFHVGNTSRRILDDGLFKTMDSETTVTITWKSGEDGELG